MDIKIVGFKIILCDDVILVIGQENVFLWIECDVGIEFDKWGVLIVDEMIYEFIVKGVFFGGDSVFGFKNIIWVVEYGYQVVILIYKYCQGENVVECMLCGFNFMFVKMGVNEWMYFNFFDVFDCCEMLLVELKQCLVDCCKEVEVGFMDEQIIIEVQCCLNCDVQMVFDVLFCKECDVCFDICLVDCLLIVLVVEEVDLCQILCVLVNNVEQVVYVFELFKDIGWVMVKDEDFCFYCGLCVECCFIFVWDMQDVDIFIFYVIEEVEGVVVE